jgi:hypothetical protein
MSTSFGRFVKLLLEKVLKDDFDVASFDIILAHVQEDKFEMANIKFTNAQRIFSSTVIFMDVLFTRVMHSLFAYYLEARPKIEINDEPEDCSGLIVFRDHTSVPQNFVLHAKIICSVET